MSQTGVTKIGARQAIERLPEVRAGLADIENSVLGFNRDNGHVWALLNTPEGVVQYRGIAGEPLKRNRVEVDGSDEFANIVNRRSNEGFEDLSSNALPSMSWDTSYRGSPKKKGRPRGANYKSPSPWWRASGVMECVSRAGC